MDKQLYETSDLGLAAALIASDIALESMDYSNPRRVLFLFDSTIKTKSAVELYWSGRLHVPALAYFEQTKVLKSRVYGGAR